MKINLEPFCSKDENRASISEPFSHGEYTFATDGRVIIQVDSADNPAEPYRSQEPGPDGRYTHGVALEAVRQVGKWDHAEITDWLPVTLPPPVFEQCDECEGTGKLKKRKCEECEGDGRCECDCGNEHDCGFCRGNGYIKVESAEPCKNCAGTGKLGKTQEIEVGSAVVSSLFLALIAALPNPQIFRATDERTAIPFRCDGGTGYVMPMRRGSLIKP